MKINSILIKDFKGIKSLEVKPGCRSLSVVGDNGTGKTSFYDAFLWCITGRDSLGQADFDVFNTDGNTDSASVAVEFIPDNGGANITFFREVAKKYEVKRGTIERVYKGTSTTYCINGVATKMEDYNNEVKRWFGDGGLFNPMSFNTDTPKFGWKERRAFLFKLADLPSDMNIMQMDMERWKLLFDQLCNNVTFDAARAAASQSVKNVNEKIKSIPGRIDELNRQIVADNSAELQSEKESLGKVVSAKPAGADKIGELEEEIDRLDVEIGKFSYTLNQRKAEMQRKYDSKVAEMNGMSNRNDVSLKSIIEEDIKRMTAEMSQIELDITKARENWYAENIKEFDPSAVTFAGCICPLTNAECTSETKPNYVSIEQQEIAFNSAKTAKLENIQKTGVALSEKKKLNLAEIERKKVNFDEICTKITEFDKKLVASRQDAETLKKTLDTVAFTKEESESVRVLMEQKATTENELLKFNASKVQVNNGEMEKAKSRISEIDSILGKISKNADILKRIAELEAEEQALAQERATSEGLEDLFSQFVWHKCDLIELKVNSMFKLARFKFFDKQVNGGVSETCECIVDNVPYSSLNHAKRVNVGIDILNVVNAFRGVSLPIFVDNAESVTEMMQTDSQLVRMVVTKGAGLEFVIQ